MIDKKTKKGIRNSRVFLVLMTKNYIEEYMRGGRVKEVAVFAKYIGKQFRVILDDDVIVPKGFEDGVKDYKVFAGGLKKFKDLSRDEALKFLNGEENE